MYATTPPTIAELPMVISPRFPLTFLIFALTTLSLGDSQPILNSVQQESVYQLLESLNSGVEWRSLFPDDLCSSAPHSVVCGYPTVAGAPSIVELSFGYVSDYNPNPTCTPNSTLPDPNVFSSFPHLRKLFFYNCFTQEPVSLPYISRVGSEIEELVFIDNPSLFGSLSDNIGDMKSLRRLIITGTNISGEIPVGFGELINLEEATLSGNSFAGELPENLSNLKKLRVLDVSQNGFTGELPESIGELENLLKLDVSSNRFSGVIPETMEGLRGLELLDVSDNGFCGGGVPLFLLKMRKLKGVYLSGNKLGGVIPDIWEKLRGVEGIGLSRLGLVGEIPSSMGVFLENVSYLGLDNNNLSGRVPFSKGFVGKIGGKVRLEGNPELCVDEGVIESFSKSGGGGLVNLKVCNKVEDPRYALVYGTSSSSGNSHHVYWMLMTLFILLW